MNLIQSNAHNMQLFRNTTQVIVDLPQGFNLGNSVSIKLNHGVSE